MSSTEPVLTFPNLVSALVGIVVAFGARWEFTLSEAEVAAIMFLATVLGSLIARHFAWSARSVERVTGEPIRVAERALQHDVTIEQLPQHMLEEARSDASD